MTYAIVAHRWWLLLLAGLLFVLIWVARKVGITDAVEGKMFGGALKGPVPALLFTGGVVAVVVFVALEIKASDKEPAAPSAYCRSTSTRKPSDEMIGPQRQPAKGTACINESSSTAFFEGQLSLSIGPVDGEGKLEGVSLNLHADQAGLTDDSSCHGFPPLGTGDVLGVEVINSPHRSSYSGEIHVTAVHRHSAIVYATWRKYSVAPGVTRNPTGCLYNQLDVRELHKPRP